MHNFRVKYLKPKLYPDTNGRKTDTRSDHKYYTIQSLKIVKNQQVFFIDYNSKMITDQITYKKLTLSF